MKTCDIQHPFLFDPGYSQLKRARNAIGVGDVQIDGRKLADFLHYINQYAKQVNLHSYRSDSSEGEFILLSDWSKFFEKSIPFLLANISRYNVKSIEEEFEKRKRDFEVYPTAQNLDLMIDFCYEEVLLTLQKWYQTLKEDERSIREFTGISPEEDGVPFGFKRLMAELIGSELPSPFLDFIHASKVSSVFHCVQSRNFFPFLNQQIWSISMNTLIQPPAQEEGSKNLLELAKIVSGTFSQFLSALRRLSDSSANYIAESLVPLEESFRKNHEPHLSLFFAFLELFKYIQGDINKLTAKHLDFFYQKVLKIKPRAQRPDYAHLVFEVAQHLKEFKIPSFTQFKDGKDLKKADVLFGLPEEIIIDKAKVESLRTLYLNQDVVNALPPILIDSVCRNRTPVTTMEGVYMAPIANSADGLGKPFSEGVIPNWSTLGAKESKSIAPGKTAPAQHPFARIGFLLASPVLFLQEGRREVTITLCCDFNGNKSILEYCRFFQKLDKALKQPYYKLTEGVLQKLTVIFSPEAFEFLKESLISHTNFEEFLNAAEENNFSQEEVILLSCYVKENFGNLKSSELEAGIWNYVLNQLANPLSDAGRAYLSGLLAAQNPNIFGYDLDRCLKIQLEPSCEPMFSDCEIALLKALMDKDIRGVCYLDHCNYTDLDDGVKGKLQNSLKALFPENDPMQYLPVYLDINDLESLTDEHDSFLFTPDEITAIGEKLICDSVFKISLSGKEGWHNLKRVKTQLLLNRGLIDDPNCTDYPDCQGTFEGDCGDVQFRITISLDENEPPIVCFDQEKLKEDYQFDSPLPVAKIELNNELKLDFSLQECKCDCGKKDLTPNKDCPCCLEKRDRGNDNQIALYHFFRGLKVKDVAIDVAVCGIKENILIQNDESILDINNPFTPFGVRPNIVDLVPVPEDGAPGDPGGQIIQTPPNLNLIGPNFYIGSNEILKKCWSSACIHLNWKEKPANIEEYYRAYKPTLKEEDFEVNVSVLHDGNWKKEIFQTQTIDKVCCKDGFDSLPKQNPYSKRINPFTHHLNRELFKEKGIDDACECPKDLPNYPSPFPYEQTIKIESRFFPMSIKREKNVCNPTAPYKANSRDGFIRLTLENQDFFHKDYAYILSRQMIALSKYPEIIPDAVYVGQMPGEEAQAIDINELLDWVCFAKNKADLVLDNDKNNDLFSFRSKIDNLLKKTTTQINGDLGSLESFLIEIGEELKKLNPPPHDHNLVKDDIVFEKFWGDKPPMPTEDGQAGGDIILNPNSLIGRFEDLKNHFREDPDSVINHITTLGNSLGSVSDKLNLEEEDNLVVSLFAFFNELKNYLDEKCAIAIAFGEVKIPIPNEPWTPTIQNIALDYTACATKEDIDLIHLYPYDGTYKHEDIEVSPTLFPYFDDEGTLFIGLKDLRPGSNLHLLFQLAESTADSELDRAKVYWSYLSNNYWQPLREGFEIISDETKGLTVSGIIKFAVPPGFSRTGNTIMPADLYWIKASVKEFEKSVSCNEPGQEGDIPKPGKVKAICDTLSVHTQAAKVVFEPTAENDLKRLNEALPANRISKMVDTLAGVKKIEQPYPTFGGRAPEEGDNFYLRVSEHLRHKGRGVAAFDYETMVLEGFSQIFKVKCINHDFGLSAKTYRMDLEMAPGFVVLAVIPDLTKLQPGQGMEPKAPVSLLEEIKAYLKKRISPFIRLKVLNPRYEKVNVKITVKLRRGKNKAYYSAKLKEDLAYFLAPWFITKDSDKLVFGQSVNYSEIVKFVEKLDYVDYITCLELTPDPALSECGEVIVPNSQSSIEPLTSRSILTAGDICVTLTAEECDKNCDSNGPENKKALNQPEDFYAICKTEDQKM